MTTEISADVKVSEKNSSRKWHIFITDGGLHGDKEWMNESQHTENDHDVTKMKVKVDQKFKKVAGRLKRKKQKKSSKEIYTSGELVSINKLYK